MTPSLAKKALQQKQLCAILLNIKKRIFRLPFMFNISVDNNYEHGIMEITHGTMKSHIIAALIIGATKQ